jgi:hypothetical protein
MPNIYNPSVVIGDTLVWAFNITGPTGATYNLSGTTLSMQVRKSYYPGSEIVGYVLGISSGTILTSVDGITGGLAASTGGLVYVTVGSNYTQNLSNYVPAFYDIQLQYPNNGGIATILRGTINPISEVTENN